MGYCRYKQNGFHVCSSAQFNLWQKDIEQGDLCDVHYWQEKFDKSNKQNEVTINLLRNQVESLKKEIAKNKTEVDIKKGIEWHSGNPPHVGWWIASSRKDNTLWRWWNGKEWSFGCKADEKMEDLIHKSQQKTFIKEYIEWSYEYPENARVPRIDPRKSK